MPKPAITRIIIKKLVCPLIILCVLISLNSPSALASSFTVTVDVYAEYNSIFNSPGDPGNPPPYEPFLVDTGIDLNICDKVEITASGQWRISPSDPLTDANGQIGRYASGLIVSSLVGQISQDGPHLHRHGYPSPVPFFYIGTSYMEIVQTKGRLYLGFNDTDYGNNEGYVTVNITVTPGPELPLPCGQQATITIDIKPQSCPNPLNINSRGVLPVAILGTKDLNVATIDPASIRLAGVPPLRSNYEDVSTPLLDKQDECECTTEGPDGYTDLTLKFSTQDIVSAIGSITDGDTSILTLTGKLYDGTETAGEDCVVIIDKSDKGRKNKK